MLSWICWGNNLAITIYDFTIWLIWASKKDIILIKPFSHNPQKNTDSLRQILRAWIVYLSHEWMLLQPFTQHKVKNQHSMRVHIIIVGHALCSFYSSFYSLQIPIYRACKKLHQKWHQNQLSRCYTFWDMGVLIRELSLISSKFVSVYLTN